MRTADEPIMIVRVSGPGWRVDLEINPPEDAGQIREFDVPALGSGVAGGVAGTSVGGGGVGGGGVEAGGRRRIEATVRYTSAVNRGEGWRNWHVKIYRCTSQGDAEALRQHLHRQAAEVQQANVNLPGPPRTGIQPPWAVVPAHIARGDGEQDTLDGGVRTRIGCGAASTRLAAPADELADAVAARLPAWFTGGTPTPELCLLAVSPSVQPVEWEEFRETPGTEQLAAFVGMAVGLDTLHRGGTVHCDIKPDNVCRYVTDTTPGRSATANQIPVSGYVLIDADAVTRVNPSPVTLRTSELYEYGGITNARRYPVGSGYGIDAGVLRAQDRFGFALVVLTALAGRDWVVRVLLTRNNDDYSGELSGVDVGGGVGGGGGAGAGRRRADDRDAVRYALRQHWQDTADRCWEPLIEALTEPFGPDIEDLKWSAADWVRRLIEAERLCVRSAGSSAVALPTGDPARFRRVLERIRAEASAAPAPRPELIQHGYEALRRHANTVAARQAAIGWLLWAGVVVVVVLLFVTSALGWEM